MNRLQTHYKPSLALLTDLYQLTMAYGYWKLGTHNRQAVFHMFFRRNPFDGGYAIACGLQDVVEYAQNLRFDSEDLAYLALIEGNDGKALFETAFLDVLRELKLSVDIDAVAEGTAVFSGEPLVRVSGPILQCQLLETPLLNLINFQTLIATKAARICDAAGDDPVLEFGLRRAQGIDGSISASRAAYVGGCDATSNLIAGKLFGIPVRGTHAHSWVMSFDEEPEAFSSYARAMPNNVVLLVDTYNTLQGVRNAARIGQELRKAGHRMIGVRLDSGDLAYLSIEARKILDEAGLPDAQIFASNDLDEHLITTLKQQGAKINAWGVGTRLVTGHDQPALGGVYKLAAIRDSSDDAWTYKLKVSEQLAKTSCPGVQQVRRYSKDGLLVGDVIFNEPDGASEPPSLIDPLDATRQKRIGVDATGEDLLRPVIRSGQCVSEPESLGQIRARAKAELAQLHPTIRRFVNPHRYPVGLDPKLHALRHELIVAARTGRSPGTSSK